MSASSLHIEFKKYWALLTTFQKESILQVIRSFNKPSENTQQVQEAEALYKSKSHNEDEEMLQQLTDKEKYTIMLLMKAFLPDEESLGNVTIEQYNKEIDEAMKRIEAGEYISHEDVEKEADKW